jgi:xylulokinase
MPYVLGVDIGTEGTKVLVISDTGEIVKKAYASYQFDIPESGWTEQDPEVWWNSFLRCLDDLWNQGASPADIVCIGVAGQMHSSVLLDKNGVNIRKSILWNDTRTKQICDDVLEFIGKTRYQGETCNSLLPGFTLGKLLWVKKNEPQVYSRCDKVLMPKDYINFKLTGSFSADVSDASGTGVFDVRNRIWHEGILHELNLPLSWFPTVSESGSVIGEVTLQAARITGLRMGTPVIAGAADNAAAAVGMGVVTSGRGLVSIGTSGVVLSCLEAAPSYEQAVEQNPTLHVFCHAMPGMWYGMGVTQAAGASLRWFKDSLGQGKTYDELIIEASRVEAGSNGLTYLPFLTGERTPYNSDRIRGGFVGLNLQHGLPHFVRAVIEGVSYSLRDCLELIQHIPVDVDELVVTGGVVNSSLWLQILCDILDTPLVVQGYSEGAAYGVGLLAGISQGFWRNVNEARPKTSGSELLHPSIERKVYENGYQQYKQYAKSFLDNSLANNN